MLEKDDFVTVIDEDNYYFKDQGTIINIHKDDHPEGPIEVAIERLRLRYKKIKTLSGPFHNLFNNEYKFRFFPEQLEISEISDETMSKRLFGDMFHSLISLKDPLDESKKCMAEGCEKKQKIKSFINFWGTVYPVYLCDSCHERWNGKCTESLPFL